VSLGLSLLVGPPLAGATSAADATAVVLYTAARSVFCATTGDYEGVVSPVTLRADVPQTGSWAVGWDAHVHGRPGRFAWRPCARCDPLNSIDVQLTLAIAGTRRTTH
jgi:hypothetical protein